MPKKKKQPIQKSDVNPTQPTQVQLNANNQFCSILHASFFQPNQCDAIVKTMC